LMSRHGANDEDPSIHSSDVLRSSVRMEEARRG